MGPTQEISNFEESRSLSDTEAAIAQLASQPEEKYNGGRADIRIQNFQLGGFEEGT